MKINNKEKKEKVDEIKNILSNGILTDDKIRRACEKLTWLVMDLDYIQSFVTKEIH